MIQNHSNQNEWWQKSMKVWSVHVTTKMSSNPNTSQPSECTTWLLCMLSLSLGKVVFFSFLDVRQECKAFAVCLPHPPLTDKICCYLFVNQCDNIICFRQIVLQSTIKTLLQGRTECSTWLCSIIIWIMFGRLFFITRISLRFCRKILSYNL